jgi:hypothetical protein
MDTMRPAALLSWKRTWADSPVVRGKARQLACCWRWQTTPVRSRLVLVLVGVWAMR